MVAPFRFRDMFLDPSHGEREIRDFYLHLGIALFLAEVAEYYGI